MTCFEGWAEKDGNINGQCCCNCKWQRKIVGHPWNTRQTTKGSITKTIGYGCAEPEMEAIVMFDRVHGMCEMWTDKNNVLKMERVK